MAMRGKAATTAILVFGHAVAAVAFAASPSPAGISGSWRLQFPVMLLFSALFLAVAVWIPRAGVKPVLFIVASGFHVMAEMALGGNMAPVYVLAAVFIFGAVRSCGEVSGFVVALSYTLLVAFARGSVSAWEADLPPPSAASRALLVLFAAVEILLLERSRAAAKTKDALESRIAGLVKNMDALASANIDFQEYATRVQREAQHEERNRIAREIHDIVGYTLMNLQMMMEAAIDMHSTGSEGLPDFLRKARDQTQRGLLETRSAMRALRALAEPESAGLSGLHELAKIFENATRVKVEFNPGNFPERFDQVLEDLLRRLVQESLTNAFRHGNAATVVVNLWKTETSLRIAIHDDGAGSQDAVPGIGIAGMRERLAAVGGELEIRDGGRGFGLVAIVPYPIKEQKRERADQRPLGG